MPGPRHGWMVVKDRSGSLFEAINQARTAAYLANADISIDQIDACSIEPFGGCENYAVLPACYEEEGGWADFPGVAGNNFTTPDAAALDITGDLCVVAHVAFDDWTPVALQMIAAKLQASPQFSWAFYINTTGTLQITISPNGTTQNFRTSTANLSALTGGTWRWVAFTLDVDNGAAGHDVRFWTSYNGTTWTQLGTTITTAGVTNIFSGTSQVEVGSFFAGFNTLAGLVDHLSIRSGIGPAGVVGGTEVFGISKQTFQGVLSTATTITADTGQAVTVNHSGGSPTFLVPYVPAFETWEPLTFDTPETDDAPWFNSDYPESADALGFYVEEWTGLDDKHVTRSMTRTGRDRGGASPGVIGNRERVMALNVYMFANSEEGMSYLFRWFAALLENICSSCSSDSILIRDFCGDPDEPSYGIRELRDVALVQGLGWEADIKRNGRCFLRRASFTLAAGDPCMYLEETTPVVTPGASDLGPGLLTANYSLTRSPARPSCSELPVNTRQVYSWPAETAMGAKAPVVYFHNDSPEYAFPFRAIVFHDPGGASGFGPSGNPCGLGRLGEIYVRPMPPYSYLKWDVAGREISYRDPTTGDWTETWFLIEPNDIPLQRYFVLPCSGTHHLVLEPGTLAIERVGGVGNVFEWGGITFTDPHYPDVDIGIVERVSCS